MEEYIDGKSLLEYANSHPVFIEDEARDIFIQLAVVVHHLHKTSNITHRDLKCENVLLDINNNIRLIDFGFAHDLNSLMTTPCGSPFYIAPEIIMNQKYDKAVDIWSMGIILYAISAGNLPFMSDNIQLVYKMITLMEPKYPKNFSLELIDLLQKMMNKDPKQRITIEEILEHPWVKTKGDGTPVEIRLNAARCCKVNPADVVREMKELGVSHEKAIRDLKSPENLIYRIIHRNLQTKKMFYFRDMLFGTMRPKEKLPLTTISFSDSDFESGMVLSGHEEANFSPKMHTTRMIMNNKKMKHCIHKKRKMASLKLKSTFVE